MKNYTKSKIFSYIIVILVAAGMVCGLLGYSSMMALCYALPAGSYAGKHLAKLVYNV